MSSKIEKIEAVCQALLENIPIKQLCADCAEHRRCKISEAITDIHIKNLWVTLRCVRCERYLSEKKEVLDGKVSFEEHEKWNKVTRKEATQK
jgi:hypothetical protein